MLTVHTFGDSILDCGSYNEHLLDPGRLLVANDDRLFPEFRGRDLSSRGPARLAHHAVDGSVADDLPRQLEELTVEGPSVALLTIGGNDLLQGLLDDEQGCTVFQMHLIYFLTHLPIRPVLIGTVYDPTFGDDSRNFFADDPQRVREDHRWVNGVLSELGTRYGAVVDLHRHFLGGSDDWFTRTIEPSLIGASEIRRCFLEVIEPNYLDLTR